MGDGVFISMPLSRLESLGDRIHVRDPAGASARPSLTLGRSGSLEGTRRFLIVHEYDIRKDKAVRFLDVTRDENPIHIESEIVPGAMTLSKTLMVLEVLADHFAIDSVKAKFTGISFYGQRTLNHFFISPGKTTDRVEVSVNTYQAGRMIAKTEVTATTLPAPPRVETETARGEETVPPPGNVELLRTFCESLDVDPREYVQGTELRRTSFPRAFLASLPSGEMVRQFKGSGGMLNVLSIDFTAPSLSISSETLPHVSLERGRTGPMSFSRVITRIIDGIRTYGKGFALVHAPSRSQA